MSDLKFSSSRKMTFRDELRAAANLVRPPHPEIAELLDTIANTEQLGSPTFCAGLKAARMINAQPRKLVQKP